MRRRLLLVLLIVAFLLCANGIHASESFVWREAETADETNFSPRTAEGPAEVLSGGRWLVETLTDVGQVKARLGQGRHLKYRFALAQAGTYTFWLRLGYESARPTLAWRLDDGVWREIKPTELTINLTFVSNDCQIGWVRAGTLDLTAGYHTLELRADQPHANRFLLALDVFALVPGDWTPDGPLPPGQLPSSERDRQAAATVFTFPASTAAVPDRVVLPLDGLWQVCRDDDPDMDQGTYEPARALPAKPIWRGVRVPSDLRETPALNMAHRVWYRCRVDVPAAYAGRSFVLDFAGTNWIASVVVNGRFVGWHKSTRVPWQLDITTAVKPGEINEILVGIKDPWYAIDAPSLKKTLDDCRHIPAEDFRNLRFVAPIFPSTKGDADGTACGLTDPVRLVVAGGPVYVADVFIRTTVTDAANAPVNKTITAEITLANPSDLPAEVAVGAEAVFAGDGRVEKELAPVEAEVPAGGSAVVTLSAPWPEARLWWPGDDPAAMYTLRTTVFLGGKAVDRHEQPFGFRAVKIDGPYIRINGLRRNFWNLLGGLSGKTPEEALAHFRRGNNRFERFGADLGLGKWFPTRREQLDWTDRHGIPGRLSTMIDGMFITYNLNNPLVWENFAEHVEQVVRAYRNHPSIIVYSLENELLFINGALGFPDNMDGIEHWAKKYLIETARRLDPTRPSMLDGAGALKDQSADIFCVHYAEDGFHPDNARPLTGIISQGRWIWNGKKPYAAGEIAYFSGNNADHAWIGGESAAESKASAKKAYAKYLRYLFERYRWNDVAIICPWTEQDGSDDCFPAMSPLAAFTREYNTTFFGGETVRRTVKVFNDTFSAAPVTFAWSLEVGGKRLAGGSETLRIEPGFAKELTIEFTSPEVKERTPAKLVLEVTQEGAEPFREAKEYTFFPRIKSIALKRPVFLYGANPAFARELAVLGVKTVPIRKTAEARPGGILIVAPDSLKAGQSIEAFIAYAKAGGRVLMLEQHNPPVGMSFGMPLILAMDQNHRIYGANFNFPLAVDTPLLKDLGEKDLSNWAGDAPTTRNVWGRPAAGNVRSWIACGPGLSGTSLLEIPYGSGLIIATQMRVGGKLAIEPAAQILLRNMLVRCDSYRKPTAAVGLYAPDRPEIADFVRELGCRLVTPRTLAQALDAKTAPILIVGASKRTLTALCANKTAVDRYLASGGWIMLWGLEPDGLAAYNSLLGTEHILREFRTEAVRLVKDPVTAGLSSTDLALFADKVIAPWSGQRLVSPDVYTYCVDGEDIAPFCFGPPNPDYLAGYQGAPDHTPYNVVNGLFSDDFWWYIYQIWYDGSIPPARELITLKLPVPCKLKEITIWNNAYYDTIEDCDIVVDGKTVARVELPDAAAPLTVDLGGLEARESVTLVAQSIRKRQGLTLIGLDEIRLRRELPAWSQGRVFFLDTVGGLVRYPRGRGGFILNQLKLAENDLAENLTKKRRIVSIILQNLGAAFVE